MAAVEEEADQKDGSSIPVLSTDNVQEHRRLRCDVSMLSLDVQDDFRRPLYLAFDSLGRLERRRGTKDREIGKRMMRTKF